MCRWNVVAVQVKGCTSCTCWKQITAHLLFYRQRQKSEKLCNKSALTLVWEKSDAGRLRIGAPITGGIMLLTVSLYFSARANLWSYDPLIIVWFTYVDRFCSWWTGKCLFRFPTAFYLKNLSECGVGSLIFDVSPSRSNPTIVTSDPTFRRRLLPRS